MVGAIERPNILFVLTDDQSYRTVTSEAMPYFSSEPYGHWVKFDRAVITTPLCHPLRTSMITGQRSDHHGRPTNAQNPPVFDEVDSIGQWMSDAGYHCGLVGKYLNGYPWSLTPYRPPGWSYWRASTSPAYFGWLVYDDNGDAINGQAGEYLPDFTAQWATDFITAAPTDQPWFCYFAPITPHDPWDIAPRHASLTIADEEPANFNEGDNSDKPTYMQNLAPLTSGQQTTARNNRKNTKRMLRALDEGLEQVFEAIDARGDMDNTIIVYHTDNGYPYGEHRRYSGLDLPKGVPYRWCVDPQLRIRYPGATARTEHAPVTTCDVTATWVSAAQATVTQTPDGASLERILCEQSITWRTHVEARYVGTNDVPQWWVALREDGMKLARYPSGVFELYDWVADPDELTSLHASQTSTVSSMDAELSLLIADSLHWLDPGEVTPEYRTTGGSGGGGGFLPFFG